MAQVQVAAGRPPTNVVTYWDLPQKVSTVDDTITWCHSKKLLATQYTCQCVVQLDWQDILVRIVEL